MDTTQSKELFTKENMKKNIGILFVGIVVLVVVLVNFLDNKKEELAKEEAALLAYKAQGCIPLSGTGKQTYDILTDEPKPFHIVQVSVDPVDVKEGETQKIMVKVQDDGNTATKASSIKATIYTDNKNTAAAAFILRPAQDSKDDSPLFTTWEGSWTRDDSSCRTYMETIIATNDEGEETKVDLSFK